MPADIPDINPYEVYSTQEQLTDGTFVYLTITVLSTVAPNIVNVNLASDGEGILTSRDHPVKSSALAVTGIGDFADISGTSGGAGDGIGFIVATVVSDNQFTISGTVGNSTGGSVSFRWPPGSTEIGYSEATTIHITHDQLQGAVNDLDHAIPVFGTAIADFGPYPGSSDTTVTVTGQPYISSTSVIEAWITPIATVDHSVDEHRVEEIQADADNIVSGVGFTVFVRTRNDLIYGKWSIAWEYRPAPA